MITGNQQTAFTQTHTHWLFKLNDAAFICLSEIEHTKCKGRCKKRAIGGTERACVCVCVCERK